MTRAAIARLGDIRRSPTGFRGTLFWYEATRIAEAHASCRYRIGNLLPHLAKSVAMFGRWSPGRMPVRRVVSVRPNLTISKAVRLSSLRTEGCHLVGDFDDLLFSDRATGRPAWVARHAEGYVRALRAFDVFTVATSALAERLARKRPDAVVRVVRNGVSAPWLAAASDVSAWVEGDPLVIRYFSGSPSHDRDFATVADVLSDFLRAHPDVELEVIGPEIPPLAEASSVRRAACAARLVVADDRAARGDRVQRVQERHQVPGSGGVRLSRHRLSERRPSRPRARRSAGASRRVRRRLARAPGASAGPRRARPLG